jgi:hypothetical protein
VVHEHGRTATAKQELATSRLALGVEQVMLGVEQAPRAFAKGQAQSNGRRISELEMRLS